MSDHARALAAQFRHMNADVIRFAKECSPDDWRRMVPHEGRSVAYLIDHIAWGYRAETKAIRAIVTGQEQPLAWDELPPTFTMEDLHAMNATRWEADPYPDREETIERLRAEGERTAAVLGGLSEADLERTIIGLDHMVVGKRLAEKWKLPAMLRDCVWLHGQLPQALPRQLAPN